MAAKRALEHVEFCAKQGNFRANVIVDDLARKYRFMRKCVTCRGILDHEGLDAVRQPFGWQTEAHQPAARLPRCYICLDGFGFTDKFVPVTQKEARRLTRTS